VCVYPRLLIGFAQTQAFPRLPASARMIRACCVTEVAAALAHLSRGCADGAAVRIAGCGAPLLMSTLRLQLLRFGPPFASPGVDSGGEEAGVEGNPDQAGLPIVEWEEWKSAAQRRAKLSVWPLIAQKTDSSQLSFDAAYERDLEEGDEGGSVRYRAFLERLVGVDVAEKLARGVDEAALHSMLNFLFVGVEESEAP